MARIIQGTLDAKGSRFAVVISRFNSFISDRLLSGALDALERHGAATDDISVVWVPGSFEVPPVARRLALSGKFDAVICLGALLRGETPHFDHLSSTVTKELGSIGLEAEIPVINGILTCNTMEQAVDRAGLKTGNKGFDAAVTAIEMVQVLKQL
ncbi:MAG: 6,7-dimethyl-8-ribityllumazine synthase [Acidobacteriota bacterium]|jgi:6,7-dimethyl-8-ribityllumazine synthase|nr:6,7-dimethyl-8-ribityllumazine synthase [Acidobacteriota bacterium]NLT33471.1 6,7-dimethyl-8-ribityllumazine synthase [Acidobacteriota bacterium]